MCGGRPCEAPYSLPIDRYCRFLDVKDRTAWRDLFTDDFVGDPSEAGGQKIEGADAFVAFVHRNLGSPRRNTVHQVHAPEIDLVSPSTARGIWALEDFVRLAPGLDMHGYGHYHETYEKGDGQWRIKSSKLTRLREDIALRSSRSMSRIVSETCWPWRRGAGSADSPTIATAGVDPPEHPREPDAR